jgi:hypothetical protein
MCHYFNLDCRKELGFKAPITKGDLLICNRTSQIWPVLNGDRMLVESVGNDHNISLLLPGMASKIEVWLKNVQVRNLENDKTFSVILSMDYLLNSKPSLSKNITRALVANYKMTSRDSSIESPAYLNPFLNPALFRYGYSQTGHKLQGTECESITIIVKSIESLKYSEFGRRYAYTAITRARKSVFIVEMGYALD